ncbi:mRNA interferase RelE/StbE [Rhizobium aquaticum]|uniref:mRNA interferase RelE/StbE n=1 Tax=Rhizobium aquaticum TaxID=1549636 RepID=A0ABV2J3C1_9HYPH
MAWTIEYNAAARKSVERLDSEVRKRIKRFLEERVAVLEDPRQIGDALKGTALGHLWRYRVGDYRVLCDIQDNKLVVLVVDIDHRKQVYR